MRAFLVTLLTLSAFLAGCSDNESGGDDEAPDTTTPTAGPAVLEPLHFQEDLVFGIDPFNVVPVGTPAGGGAPCSTPASTCFYYPFTIPANTTVAVTATLAWGLPANDFDLYLYQATTLVSSDGINMLGTAEVPPTTQVLRHTPLVAGDYEFWVAAWNSAADGFTLDVEFTAP